MAENLRYTLEVDNTAAVGAINDFFNTFAQGAAKAKSTLNSALGQELKTEIKIEFKNGELIAKQVQSINQESNKLAQVYNAVNGEIGKTPNQLKQQLSILKQLQGDTIKYANASGQVTKEWTTLQQRINTVQSALNSVVKGNPFQQLISSVKGLAGQFALVQTLSNAVTNGLNAMGQAVMNFASGVAKMEVAQLQLKAFAGNSQAAKELFVSFAQTAKQTPFNLEQVTEAGKTMLAFGLSAEEAKVATNQLGIIAGATGGDLNNLARNLGQISAQGRAYTRDLNQFATAGIPIYQELAKVLNVSVQEVRNLAEEGQIGFSEVSQALTNMTAEGSAFANIAGEIGNTWIGATEALASSFQELQYGIAEAFTAINKTFGGGVIALIQGFASAVSFVANNFQTLATVLVAVATYVAVYTFATNAAAIAAGVATAATWAWQAATAALGVAQAIVTALTGNYAAVALALGAAALVAGTLNSKFQEQQSAANNAAQGVQGVRDELGLLSSKQVEVLGAANQQTKDLALAYGNVKKELQDIAREYDNEKKVLDERVKIVSDIYDKEINKIREVKDELKTKLQEEKDNLASILEPMKARYDAEKLRLDDIKSEIENRYQIELDALDELTGAEIALNQKRRENLQARANNAQLSEEERLEAQAQLDALDRNTKKQELIKSKKQEIKGVDQEIKDLDDTYQRDKAKAEAESARRIDAIKQKLIEVENKEKDLVREKQNFIDKVNEAAEKVNDIPKNLQAAKKAVFDQLGVVKDLGDKYKETADKAAGIEDKLKRAYDEAKKLKGISSGKFTGGPVSGGQSYTVNEFGKEAFLSASGRLSMINTPAWGKWTAPSSGTIIPAHLTKMLDIPSGGINLNTATSDARLRRNSMGASAGSRSYGGYSADRITNHITIQSQNPVTDASRLMINVLKNRVKRRF